MQTICIHNPNSKKTGHMLRCVLVSEGLGASQKERGKENKGASPSYIPQMPTFKKSRYFTENCIFP